MDHKDAFLAGFNSGWWANSSGRIYSLEEEREEALEDFLAQPQAREEAKPVGWISEAVLHRMGRMDHEMIYGDKKAADYQGDAVAVYTTPPAPEAEKLRVAVEALEFYRDGFSYKIGKKSQRIEWFATGQLLDDCGNKELDALAALQAEQKGGAA